MRRLGTFICGFILGALLLYGALHYHLVHAADGLHLIRKSDATLSQTYVDIRAFGARDWLEHPELAAAIVEADQEELLRSATDQTLRNSLDRLLGPSNDR